MTPHGVLVIDKPRGPTSFDVVRRLRAALGRPKIGHGGTLDPMATGVLPICVGEATKLATFLLDADKEYEATLRLGVETDTLDADGRVTAEAAAGHVSESAVRGVLPAFSGAIRQTPPMYSALKRGGRPLHALARAGQEVDRAPRDVVVHALVLLAFTPGDRPEVVLRVRCSKGTYVRSLGADIGRALGTGGHLTALRRTCSGPFVVEQSLPLAEALRRISEPGSTGLPLVSPAEALAHLPVVRVDEGVALALEQGKRVACASVGWASASPPGGLVRLLRVDGSLLAVARATTNQTVETLRVFLAGVR